MTAPGGVKEKVLIETFDDGGIRFQGEIPLPDGRKYLDRTTLTPLTEGRVRQHIEISKDGKSWESGFDAIYVPKTSRGRAEPGRLGETGSKGSRRRIAEGPERNVSGAFLVSTGEYVR